MKALFLTKNPEDQHIINNILYGRFSKSTVTYCPNLEIAIEHLNFNGPYGLFIIDTDLKDEDPNDVYLKLAELAGPRPTLFLGSPSVVNTRVSGETLNAHKCNQILDRPLNIDKLVEFMTTVINWLAEENFEEGLHEINPLDYIPMKVKNFYFFNKIEQDAYVEVTETKYMKIIVKGKEYHPSLIDRFVARGIKKLFLEKSELTQFLEDSVHKLSKLLSYEHLKFKKAVYLQIQSIYIIHQYLRTLGVRDPLIDLVKIVIGKTSEKYLKIQNFIQILEKFPFSQNDLYEQSVITNYLCETILMKIGWESDLSRFKLGLASVLHEFNLPHEEMRSITAMTDSRLLNYTSEEIEQFKNHPIGASEISKQFTGFSESDFIITQHHEMPDGSGFPYGVNAHKLTKLSCIFILSNNFIIEISQHEYSKKSIRETLKTFKHFYSVGNFREPLNTLLKIFAHY